MSEQKSIKSLSIYGYRGFGQQQRLRFAQPNGKLGSGLTIIVGPNGGGKTTVIESLRSFATDEPTFSAGKRNPAAENRVSISIQYSDNGDPHELNTVESGGSETKRIPEKARPKSWYIIPSRRYFKPFFINISKRRERYLDEDKVPRHRGGATDDFAYRLLDLLQNPAERKKFNRILGKLINPAPDWTIDQSDQGGFYVKVQSGNQFYTSDGMGDGIVSLLFIADALWESSPGGLIAIDEPELSLHPAIQRRLAHLLAERSAERQIVIATHSPIFTDFEYIQNGAELVRVYSDSESARISQLKRSTVSEIGELSEDLNNPHVLGLQAREVFFRDDRVVVLEGQEDVHLYRKHVLPQLESKGLLSDETTKDISDSFFGWGAGGAAKIEKIMALLKDLGFKKVIGIFDHNEKDRINDLMRRFDGYLFRSIPADDVREKTCKSGESLLDNNYTLRQKFLKETKQVFRDIDQYLRTESTPPVTNPK